MESDTVHWLENAPYCPSHPQGFSHQSTTSFSSSFVMKAVQQQLVASVFSFNAEVIFSFLRFFLCFSSSLTSVAFHLLCNFLWSHSLIQPSCLSSGIGLGIVPAYHSSTKYFIFLNPLLKIPNEHSHPFSYSFNHLNDSTVGRQIKEMQIYWYIKLYTHHSWHQTPVWSCPAFNIFLRKKCLAAFWWDSGGVVTVVPGMLLISDRCQLSLLILFLSLCEIEDMIDSWF